MTAIAGQAASATGGRLRTGWSEFWFAPERAGNLALARILVAAHALWILASRNYAAMSDVPAVFWQPATDSIRWRYLILPGHGGIEQVLQVLAAVALVGALLGVAPRLCCALGALLLYHLAPLETAIWNGAPEARGMTLAPTALLILAASRSADTFTLWPRPRAEPNLASAEYGWALRLVQLLVCQIYLFSAIGKLVRTGFSWGSAEYMQLWLLWFNQDDQSVVFGTLGPWLAQHLWLCGLIGVGTVVMEWLMPVMLFWRRSRLFLVPAALLFHIGVLLAMNIHVPEAWLVLVFVDWMAVARQMRARRAGG